MKNKKKFIAIKAHQSQKHNVLSFPATADEILAIADIERAGRDKDGKLYGFQRPEILSHINEIADYLNGENAVLPNSIVIAFVGSTKIKNIGKSLVELEIDISNGAPGLVVDGQQRLSALSRMSRSNFQAFVSALICEDNAELRKQFVLINNTRPLPKSLIYELLPSVTGLPDRFSSKSKAAALIEHLNFDPESRLTGQIKLHTNPEGVIRDTSIQKVITNSLSDGVMRNLIRKEDGFTECSDLIGNFYGAVSEAFKEAWIDHSPKSSRLIHGVGIKAMGYVMELLVARDNAWKKEEFQTGLHCLHGHTAWTSGEWRFSENEVRPWNGLQNIRRDVWLLADHLIRIIKANNTKTKNVTTKLRVGDTTHK